LTPASASATPPDAVLTPDLVSTCAIGTPVRAAAACASASASSARAIDGDLVVARIDLNEEGTAVHPIVVVDGHLDHGAADARRDLRNVPIDLRIVGRLVPARQQPDDGGNDDEHGDGGRNDPRTTHSCLPPRYDMTADSVTPRARASVAFARLCV
jgi:hypothetical protein